MATGVFFNKDGSDKAREGVVIDTQSGFESSFSWFAPDFAHGIAKGYGLAQAGAVTQGVIDQIKKDMATLRARLDKR